VINGTAYPTVMPSATEFDPAKLSTHDTATEVDPADISAAQRAEVADGVVTFDEYQAAFQRLKACMAAKGYTMEPATLKNEVIQAPYRDTGDSDKVYTACYSLEYAFVDSEWQTYRENFGKEAGYLAECLREHGVEPGVTYDERDAQLFEIGVDPVPGCLKFKDPDYQ
jgi:hypothetical protein